MLYHFGRFQLDTEEYRLSSGGQPVSLEPKTLLLLGYLVGHPGKLIRKQELLDAVWPDANVTENALTRSITVLRRALEDSSRDPQFIETVPKVGYRFIAEIHPGLSGDPAPDTATHPARPQTPEAAPAAETHDGAESAAPPAATSRWPRRNGPALAIAAAVLVGLGLWVGAFRLPAVQSNSVMPYSEGASAVASPNDTTAPADRNAAREEIRRGLFFYDKRNGPASEAAFRHAIELDPRSASAHAGLAQALITQSLLAKAASPATIASAEAEARKAVALDPESDEAYVALGTVQATFTWQWREAEQNLTRGLRIRPKNATGNMWYAVYLDAAGRPEEAVQQVRQAVDADPLSFFMLRQQASILYFGRHYDEALRVLERAREMSPAQTAILDNWRAWIDEQRGLYDEAVEHDLSRQRDKLTGEDVVRLRAAYRKGGWRAYWSVRLDQMHPETQAGCGLYVVGRAYLRVGERDQAFRYLQKAAEQHCFWLSQVLVDPGLDDLRQDPRFPQLVALVDPVHQLSRNQ